MSPFGPTLPSLPGLPLTPCKPLGPAGPMAIVKSSLDIIAVPLDKFILSTVKTPLIFKSEFKSRLFAVEFAKLLVNISILLRVSKDR